MRTMIFVLAALAAVGFGGAADASEAEKPRHITYPNYPAAPRQQTAEEANAKSAGCLSCHATTDMPSMHSNPAIILGCTDCHGGNAVVALPHGVPKTAPAYRATLDKAHVQPLFPDSWHYPKSANPERSYTLLNRESPEFVRFVNGVLRQAKADTSAKGWRASYNRWLLPALGEPLAVIDLTSAGPVSYGIPVADYSRTP